VHAMPKQLIIFTIQEFIQPIESEHSKQNKLWPPQVGEVSANFCGRKVSRARHDQSAPDSGQ
jgi:hypothetical protein